MKSSFSWLVFLAGVTVGVLLAIALYLVSHPTVTDYQLPTVHTSMKESAT